MWNHRQPRGSSYVISHSFSTSHVTSYVISQCAITCVHMTSHMASYVRYHMWYHMIMISHVISHPCRRLKLQAHRLLTLQQVPTPHRQRPEARTPRQRLSPRCRPSWRRQLPVRRGRRWSCLRRRASGSARHGPAATIAALLRGCRHNVEVVLSETLSWWSELWCAQDNWICGDILKIENHFIDIVQWKFSTDLKRLPQSNVEVIVLSESLSWWNELWYASQDNWIGGDILKIENHLEHNPQIQ